MNVEKHDVSKNIKNDAESEALTRVVDDRADAADGADTGLTQSTNTGTKESDAATERMKSQTQSAQLVALAMNGELFRTPDNKAYATVPVGTHKETHALDSEAFMGWLGEKYYRQCGRPVSQHSLDTALAALKAKCRYDGKSHEVFVRLAKKHDAIYLDLGDDEWRAVRIDADGWQVIAEPPVKFRRPRGMRPLPIPESGGCVKNLRRFVNVSDDEWVLLTTWMVGAFRPLGPFPVLELQGEQGTAKSTTCEMIRALIDPNTSPLRSAPKTDRDLMIAASNGWIIAYDNLSGITMQLSDALCRLSTGGGFATRVLYTDLDETLIEAQRPVMLNGIQELITRGDLLDRAMTLQLQLITPDQRVPNEELQADFEQARPKILGAFLTVVAEALQRYPDVVLEELPRMADFAKWGVAAEPALGFAPGRFMAVYDANRVEAQQRAIESSPVGPLVLSLVERQDWSGTATDLLFELRQQASEEEARILPRDPSALSATLSRLAPSLRGFGVGIRRHREGKTGTRVIEITKDRVSAVSAAA